MLSTMYFSTRTRKSKFRHVERFESERWLFWEACLDARVSFHTRVFSHISVSNSSLLWTKALACKTISTVTLFVLLITYAHIWEIGDTLSVPCHHTRARAFTFFPTFPWRVTNAKVWPIYWLNSSAANKQHKLRYSNSDLEKFASAHRHDKKK